MRFDPYLTPHVRTEFFIRNMREPGPTSSHGPERQAHRAAGATELRPAGGGDRGRRDPAWLGCSEAGPTARPCRLDGGDPGQTTAALDFRRYRVCNPHEPGAARFLVLIFGAHIRRWLRAPAEPALP